MNRLVIQLARMGDVVQSLPLLERLRTQFPRDRLTLLVDAPLVPLFERLSGIDTVLGLPMENAWKAAQDESWLVDYAWWDDALKPLISERFDEVIVLNYSHLAVTLAGVIPASVRSGYQLSEDRQQIVRPTPLNLLFASVRHRPHARWHLADLYAALAEIPKHTRPETGKIIQWAPSANRSKVSGHKNIGLIIGAGDPKRLLVPEFFADLITMILTDKDASVVLIGGQRERKRQDQILSLLNGKDRRRSIPSAGEIPLDQLPDRLVHCELVVGADTGPLHIAAWCNVPTLGLYFSSASVHQTGPHGQRCWVIDSVTPCRMCKEEDPCQTNQCRNQLSAPVVAETINWILRGNADYHNYGNQSLSFQSSDLSLKRARFDEFGITYPDIATRRIDRETQWQRQILGQVLFRRRAGLSTDTGLPPNLTRKILDVCHGNPVPEDEPSLAILKDFLEFEDLHGRPETRDEVADLLTSSLRGSRGEVKRDHETPAVELAGETRSPAADDIPRWSVIIPAHNQCHLTQQCLRSIFATTGFRDMEILVVDNGSTDDTAQMIDQWAGPVRRIDMAANHCFSKACNRGASVARGQWLLLLNNDTEVPLGWYEALNHAVSQYGADTILGCRLLYPDGRIQHAGVMFDDDGLPVHVGKGCPADDPRWNSPRSYPAVTAAAMAVAKPVFDNLGGFDEGYANGYEDVDFCLRAIEQGVQIVCVPDIEIIHHQGMTPGRYRNDARNEKRFLDKWHQTIRHHPEWHIESMKDAVAGKTESAKKVGSSKRTSGARKQFLVITGEPLNYPSPTLRLIGPLNALEEKGFLDYSVLQLADTRAAFRQNLDKSSGRNGIIVQRALPQNWMTDEVIQYVDRTGIPLILDTDDLIIGRRNRGGHRLQDGGEPDRLFLDMLGRSALVTVTTETLQKLLEEWLQKVSPKDASDLSSRIRVLPNLIDPRLWDMDFQIGRNSNGKVRMAFFGSETHGLDLAMITPAIRKVLVAHRDKVELRCWGCITEELKTVDGVCYMGPYDPDYPQYAKRLPEARVDFALVPLLPNRFNRAKSPIKYLEFGICGIPGIYSDLEPYRKVVRHEETGMLATDDTGSWLNAMTRLIENQDYRSSLADHARLDISKNYLLPNHLDKWEAALRAVTRPGVTEQFAGGELADRGVCQHLLSWEGNQ